MLAVALFSTAVVVAAVPQWIPALSFVSGDCPAGTYYSSWSPPAIEFHGNYYSGCATPAWIEANGVHLGAAEWVAIQASDWGMTASQFTQENANTWVWCQAGPGTIINNGNGWTCSQPGAAAVIVDATYIWSLSGTYIDLAPSQVVPLPSGAVVCPDANPVSCPPPITTVSESASSVVTTMRTSASSTQGAQGPSGQSPSVQPPVRTSPLLPGLRLWIAAFMAVLGGLTGVVAVKRR